MFLFRFQSQGIGLGSVDEMEEEGGPYPGKNLIGIISMEIRNTLKKQKFGSESIPCSCGKTSTVEASQKPNKKLKIDIKGKLMKLYKCENILTLIFPLVYKKMSKVTEKTGFANAANKFITSEERKNQVCKKIIRIPKKKE